MYDENTKEDTKEGNDNEVVRLERKDDSIRSNLGYDSSIPVTAASMDSNLKVVNGTEIGKKPDERMNRPNLSGHREDTTNGKKSDDIDVNPAVPGSSRHTKIVEDEESKLSRLTGPGEGTCLSKGHNTTAPELRTWVSTAEPEVDIRFA